MAIDLANNGYNPSVELTQVKASPNLQDVTVRKAQPSKAQQLLSQFGNLQPEIKESQKILDLSEKQRAEEVVNSMTTDELSKKIKEDPASLASSPVFNATVNNMHYNNISQNLQRDTLAKLADGSFGDKFSNDPESAKYNPDGSPNPNYRNGSQKLESYLLDQRNTTLAGADKYGVAGFDKVWQPFLQQALKTNSETLAKKSLENGFNTTVQAYAVSLAGTGTPDEKMARFVDADSKAEWIFKGDKDQRTKARVIALQSLADAGDVDSLMAILNHKDKDGIAIGSTLGNHVNSLRSTARAQFEANQRKAEVDGFKQASENSINEVHSYIADKIGKNQAWNVDKEYPYIKPDGTKGMMPSEPIVIAGLKAQADQLKVPPEQMDVARMNLFNRAGHVDPDMKIKVQAAVFNLNSVQYDEKGKPLGELNDSLKVGLDLLAKAKTVDPTGQYGMKLAGSGENYTTLDNIAMLKQFAGKTTEEAAGIVATAKGSRIYGENNTYTTKNSAQVTDELNNGFIMRMLGAPDNAIINIGNIQKGVTDSANLLVAAGMQPKDALESIKQSFANNVANVNGNLMFMRAIPSIPEAKDNIVGGSTALFTRWVEEIGGQAAYQTGYSPKEVTVVTDPDGNTFRLMARGNPLNGNGHKFEYTKKEIQDWMKSDLEVAKTDAQYAQVNGLSSEIGAYRASWAVGTSAGVGVNAISKFLGTGLENQYSKDAPAIEFLTSRTGYRQLKQAGMETKSKPEQIKWAKEMMQYGKTAVDPSTPIARPANEEPVTKDQLKSNQTTSGTEQTAMPFKVDKRRDGTDKGTGFLGILKRPDGKVSTEISISTDALGGREFPLLVPTLTKAEVHTLLNSKSIDPKDVPDSIVLKAQAFAIARDKAGKPLFATKEEQAAALGGKQ